MPLALLAAAAVACPLMAPAASAQDAAAPAPKPHKARPQKAGPPAADDAQPGAKDPAVAARFYTEGVKAYQTGKHPEAVAAMSNALGAGLAANLVPKALYYRGLSNVQRHEPGLAISDLNIALFFKDGLDPSERAEAKRQRSVAYREAGLEEPAESGAKTIAAGGSGERGSTATVPKQSGLGDGLGNFFGGLFGGSSSAPAQPQPQAQPQPPSTTASLLNGPHKVIEPDGQHSDEHGEETLPWAKAGENAQTASEPPPAAEPAPSDAPATAAALPPPAARHAAKAAPGKAKFRIQVASVPTRDEASGVISTLQSKGEPLSSAPVSVDPLKFGSNTYYRVRLGPYATAADTKAPCNALKAAGLDCLVTSQ